MSDERTLDIWHLQDVLRDCIAGRSDFEEHGYNTCSDKDPCNSERGCSRCIVITFADMEIPSRVGRYLRREVAIRASARALERTPGSND